LIDFSLQGKVAIVTGASQGIGAAIAVAFAQAGARVVVASHKLESVARVAQEIEKTGGAVMPVQAPMGYPEQVKSLIVRTLENGDRWISR
jgi:NAD(P)-dependent dehydrogenase (short-subunit alcohol dehydrogenase family)